MQRADRHPCPGRRAVVPLARAAVPQLTPEAGYLCRDGAAGAVLEVPLRNGSAGGAPLVAVRVKAAEDRPDPLIAVRPGCSGRAVAERDRALRTGVVRDDVAGGTVDALPLELSGERADREDLLRVLPRVSRRIAAKRLEARRHPGRLALVARLDGLLPAVIVRGEDAGGHHQVAVELVLLLDDVARVDEVVVPEPARPHAVRGGDVLHEDAGVARRAVPVRGELVADAERAGQVVARVDHQAVAEPVDALVGDVAGPANVVAHADPLRPLAGLLAGHEPRDVADLLLAQLVLERRHSAAAVRHLPDDVVERRFQVVEVRPGGAARPGRLEGVTASAPGVGEHLPAGARGRASRVVSSAPGDEREERKGEERASHGSTA